MARIQPIPDHPAGIVDGVERLLIIADYHAGFELAMRYEEGVELPSRAPKRKAELLDLLATYDPDRLIVLGDMTHSIGEPGGGERAELEVLFRDIDIPVTIAKGNHDGALESFIETDPDRFGQVSVTSSGGCRLDDIGIAHGHTWPDPTVLGADVVCIGHEHPQVRLLDDVGGARTERVWVRSPMDTRAFAAHYDQAFDGTPDLVLLPAFNELCGGTWVNEETQSFLSPFLPQALTDGSIYLLDGTYLGDRGSGW